MTPEKLREKGNRWRELGQYDLADIYNQHAAALEEIEKLKAELENEVAIVNRIWAIYGNPDYETLNGRTIYDLINADRERAEQAERRAERLQAQVDALMLEYCPDEMTPEQLAEWEKHQRAVPAEFKGE